FLRQGGLAPEIFGAPGLGLGEGALGGRAQDLSLRWIGGVLPVCFRLAHDMPRIESGTCSSHHISEYRRDRPCLCNEEQKDLNTLRTARLLAVMTALFFGVGYLSGGSGGMMIALVIAAGPNLFTYWTADKIVMAMN